MIDAGTTVWVTSDKNTQFYKGEPVVALNQTDPYTFIQRFQAQDGRTGPLLKTQYTFKKPE